MPLRNRLRETRLEHGLTAAELAAVVGVSRQTIHAIESARYVPNTTVSLRLAQALETNVEDLFRLEQKPAELGRKVAAELLGEMGSGWDCVRLAQAGRRTIAIPVNASPSLLPELDGLARRPGPGRRVSVELLPGRKPDPHALVLAGCDPAVTLLSERLRRAGFDLLSVNSASGQALDWLRDGKVHVAGSHLKDMTTGECNLAAVRRRLPKAGHAVVTVATWEQGLVVRKGNPKGIRSVAELARPDVEIVNRQQGSGSRALLEYYLRQHGIARRQVRGVERIAPSHLAAAWSVAQGLADCCVATGLAARVFGLDFIPLTTERYDLVIGRRWMELRQVEALLDLLSRSAVRKELSAVAGYDTRETGSRRD